MENILLVVQIGAIITYVAGTFILYRLLVKVFEERLAGAKEESARLRERVAELERERLSPSEALQYVELIKQTTQHKLEDSDRQRKELESKLSEAQKAGDEALSKATQEKLNLEERHRGELLKNQAGIERLRFEYTELKIKYDEVMATKETQDSMLRREAIRADFPNSTPGVQEAIFRHLFPRRHWADKAAEEGYDPSDP